MSQYTLFDYIKEYDTHLYDFIITNKKSNRIYMNLDSLLQKTKIIELLIKIDFNADNIYFGSIAISKALIIKDVLKHMTSRKKIHDTVKNFCMTMCKLPQET